MENFNDRGLLEGKHVLFVEDGYFLSDETRKVLQRLGAVVVGPVSNLHDAYDVLETRRVDAAIVDIELDDEFAFSFTEELERRGIEFVFAISCAPGTFPAHFSGFTLCEKLDELGKIAAALFGLQVDGTTN